MLEYNEIKERKYIVLDGEPHEVVSSHVFRKQQRKPVNNTKLKNLITGRMLERSFHQSEKVEEANIETKKIKFLYSNKGENWFCDENNPKNRYNLSDGIIGDQLKFLSQEKIIDGLIFNEEIMGVKMPIKMDLKVKDAPPGVKGDSAQGGTKQVTLETGSVLNVPLFINEGDVIRVNTFSADYAERVSK